MTVKELIEHLEKCDPAHRVSISIYGCSGYDDSHDVEDVETKLSKYGNWVQMSISVGCDIHRSPAFKRCDLK